VTAAVTSRPDGAPQAVYIDTPWAADQWVAALAGAGAVALDTEGASFHRFVDRIYLLQISTRSQSAIIDPLSAGPLAGLGAILENPAVEIVFHDADYDLRLLHQDYHWHVTNIFDTRVAAQLLGIRAFGLAALLERYFGVKLDKQHQRADWSMRPLTPGMLDYAAQDTRYLLDLREQLAGELRDKGRWGWAEEEFARLEGTHWVAEDPAESFLRVKGARDLSRRELSILRELVPWRDGVAAELDRATFRVVGNETLLEIARQAPDNRETLAAIKGMPRGMTETRSAEILRAVRRGLDTSDDALPRFPKAPRWDRDPDLDDRVARLKVVRDATAARLDLDPGVLCSRERLEAVARRMPPTAADLSAMPELRHWQAAELGPGFLSVLWPSQPAAAPAAPAATVTPPSDSPYRDQ
jgi:ribonuclease D